MSVDEMIIAIVCAFVGAAIAWVITVGFITSDCRHLKQTIINGTAYTCEVKNEH